MKIVKVILNNIREYIWPLLEPLEEVVPKEIEVEGCKWKDDETDLMLSYIEKYVVNEESRKSQVESKATVFIGTFSVVITVLLSLVKDILIEDASSTNNSNNIVVVLVMILAIIYLCRAIWFSIKVLERRRYYSFGFPDFMLSGDDSTIKKKKIIVAHYNNIKKNNIEINLKVDYMAMAQEYFKRAIIVVSGFSILIFVNEFILKKFNIIEAISNLNTNWILVILVISILILYTLVINIYKKLR